MKAINQSMNVLIPIAVAILQTRWLRLTTTNAATSAFATSEHFVIIIWYLVIMHVKKIIF
jgi:hypothetical protein